jgi:hypothetical protein
MGDALSRISWQDFEILVANRYRRHGWEVAHCQHGPHGLRAPGDADLRMRRDGKLALVQCRHESVCWLDASTVERFLATTAEQAADFAILITSGKVPEGARQVAEAAGVEIVEGEAVRAMLDDDLLDLRSVNSVAGINAQASSPQVISRGELPRPPRSQWRLPLFLAALAAMASIAVYGGTLARSRMEHPLPPQVDQSALSHPAP